jgi:SAM-dependent methyltransferase
MKRELDAYYAKRAATYSDLDEPPTIVACVRALGIRDHVDIIEPREGELVLDVGCGTGRFFAPLEPARVFGADLTENMLQRAKVHGRPVVRSDGEFLPFRDGSFDIVHSAGLLGVYRSKKIIEECARVAKKGGRIFISFPLRESASGRVFQVCKTLFGYNPTLLDFWYSRGEIKAMFDIEGVRIKRMHRLGWEPPFQRLYKGIESGWLVRLFGYLEPRLKYLPLFRYFSARMLVEAVKV